MGKYLRKQFQGSQFLLDHDSPAAYCLSCWLTNSSLLPLLCLRVLILLGCLAIIIASFVLTANSPNIKTGYWFIYMTHWGLVINAIASFFGVVVSWRAYQLGSIEPFQSVPWYAKVFWATYNMAIVIAFFITIYYFTILLPMMDEIEVELAVDPILDFFIHAVNSILMLLLLMTSRLPGRILHFIYPLGFGVIYLLFSVVYYFAGGTDPSGNKWIYPTLDWAKPGETSIMLVITVIILIVLHEVIVLMTATRDWLSRRCGGWSSSSLDIPYS